MGFRATGCTTIRFLREKRRSLRSPQQALSWQSLRNATTMTLSNRLANGIHGRVNSNNATRWETASSLEEIAQIGHSVSAYFALRSWNFDCSKRLPTAGAYTGTRRGWAHIIFVGANSLSVNIQDYSPSALFLPFERDIPVAGRLASWVGMTTCIDVSKSALTDLLSGSHPTDGLTPDRSVGPIDARVVHGVPLGFGVQIERVRKP